MIGASHDIDSESGVVQNQEGGVNKNGEVRNNSMDPDAIQAYLLILKLRW
jgi:hypothetical protein